MPCTSKLQDGKFQALLERQFDNSTYIYYVVTIFLHVKREYINQTIFFYQLFKFRNCILIITALGISSAISCTHCKNSGGRKILIYIAELKQLIIILILIYLFSIKCKSRCRKTSLQPGNKLHLGAKRIMRTSRGNEGICTYKFQFYLKLKK